MTLSGNSRELCIIAIQERQKLRFTFKDSQRMLNPHIMGVMSDGKLVIGGYQDGIDSLPNWREFPVEELVGLTLCNIAFEKNPKFTGNEASNGCQIVLARIKDG
jgi:hypothetical protein